MKETLSHPDEEPVQRDATTESKAIVPPKEKEPAIDRSWREQLPPEEVERLKKWAGDTVRLWHDEAKPDYIFVTEANGLPSGFLIKHTWETAYPKEAQPVFYRVDPRLFDEVFFERIAGDLYEVAHGKPREIIHKSRFSFFLTE
jgi:hypothetical protein